MAFNNPSSTKPVSYASATKSLGYLYRAVVNACSRDDDGDEQAHLLRKKKSSQENRTMVMSLCGCVCCLVTMVGIFVFALLNLTYPHPVPKGAHSISIGGPRDAPLKGDVAARGRSLTRTKAKRVKKNVDGLIGQYVGKEFGGR